MQILTVTENAKKKILEFQENHPEKRFRVHLEGGGCAGFQYKFLFDEQKENDKIVDAEGVEVVMNKKVVLHLIGSTLDYEESIMKSGFTVENPNAKSVCGCGVSVLF